MLSYLKFNTSIELMCFILSLIGLSKKDSRIWKGITIYLFIVCATEFTGLYLKRHGYRNQWPYNILLLSQIAYISLMFLSLFNKYIKSRPLVASGLALLLIVYIYEIFDHGFLVYNNTTNTIMSILFVLYGLYYYYLLLKDDDYVALGFSPNFWWVAGILLFYFGSTAVNLFHGNLSKIRVTPEHFLPYYLYMVLNLLLYGCWSYSFICKKWLIPILNR